MVTPKTSPHRACVDGWLRRAADGLPSASLLRAFELAFARVWQRAHQTLGDVTLRAILERVLEGARERFPVLSPLKIEAGGLACHELRKSAASVPREALAEGLTFLLVEFLTVLGRLTAEILTPALHAELSRLDGPLEEESPVRSRSKKSRKGRRS